MAFGRRRIGFGRRPRIGAPAKKLAYGQLAGKMGNALWKTAKAKAAIGLKKKMGGSRTRTMPVFRNVKVDGQGGQISSFKVSAKPNPAVAMMKKTNNSNYLYWNAAARLTGSPGVQVATALPYFSGGAFTTTESIANDLASIQYKITGNSTVNQPQRTFKFCAESCVGKTMITNQDSGNVELHIYDIVTRRDNPSDPLSGWIQGINDAFGSGTFTSTNLPLGSIPQASELFNVNFKVKQHTRIVLAQGQSHCHYVSLKPNRVFNSELLANADLSYAGWTCFTLIVCSGLPANDSTTATQVSSGAVNCDIVMTKQMRYTYSLDSVQNYYYTQSLPVAFTVGQSVMDIGSGVKVTDAPA